jgi:LAO/AO transport system kinase
MVTAKEIVSRLRGTDRRALPRLATLIENGNERGLEALDLLTPLTGNAHVVGITGPPGAGKSSLISLLIGEFRRKGKRVGVIAIDPSSTLTGGAVLGDRIRMLEHQHDDGVYLRSMASRGRRGGLAWATSGLVHLLDAAGFDVILVETVGIGQDGSDIANLADTVVVVEAPGMGDGVQAIKSGLLEVGDVVVVNKADLPGAAETLRHLRAAFTLGHVPSAWRVPIIAASGVTGEGVDKLVPAVNDHGDWLRNSGELTTRRGQAAQTEVLAGLRTELERRLSEQAGGDPQLREVVNQVARRERSAHRAVNDLILRLELSFAS